MSKAFSLGPITYSQEWYDHRTIDRHRNPPFVLGASDAGVVCGVSKWKTALELYYEINGARPPREESEAMMWGKMLESPILERYSRMYNMTVIRPSHMYISTERPFIAASLDAETEDEDGPISIEVKCSTSRNYSPEDCVERDCFGDGPQDIPNDYMMQIQQQLYVTGYSRCDMPVLFDGNTLRVYSIPRNEALIKKLVERATAFYLAVLNGEPPTPDWDHPTTLDLAKHLYDVSPGARITLSEEGAKWFAKWQQAKDDIKTSEFLRDEAFAHVAMEIADAEVAEVPGTRFELKRTTIAPSMWTEEDVIQAQEMLGQVKRKGYIRFIERKVK